MFGSNYHSLILFNRLQNNKNEYLALLGRDKSLYEYTQKLTKV